ncbi:MAG: hypothetical protein AAGD92_06110 [Pseudomonadota bacterium]
MMTKSTSNPADRAFYGRMRRRVFGALIAAVCGPALIGALIFLSFDLVGKETRWRSLGSVEIQIAAVAEDRGAA